MPPKFLSDVIDRGTHRHAPDCWFVYLPGGSYSGWMTRANAVELAKKEWPHLENDLD